MGSNRFYLEYNLQLFAKEGAGGEKTEEATSKKLDDARLEGQVARSIDLITAVMLMGLFVGLKVCVGYIGNGFLETFQGYYKNISTITADVFNNNVVSELVFYAIKKMLLIMAPLVIIAFVVAILMNLAQVKWKPTTKPLKPKFSNFNPISGFKKLLSKDKLVELLKAILKVSVLSYLVYDTLKNKWALLSDLYYVSLIQAIQLIGNLVIDIGIKLSCWFLGIAVADYMYQKFKFKNDMKMTKQEVKDEYKNSEGDPQIKGRIRQKMREVSQKRMMQSLPEADVVITNPTHLAVAIKYDKEAATAPIVIAKGADYLANRIKEAARNYDIEIVENKPLARMLYHNVEIGDEIPQELYQTVAEVLAYVYGLKGKLS